MQATAGSFMQLSAVLLGAGDIWCNVLGLFEVTEETFYKMPPGIGCEAAMDLDIPVHLGRDDGVLTAG
jgi:hypothetical protein